MTYDLSILIVTAASLGFFHTIVCPDHYLTFIAKSKSGNWSLRKTSFITFLCGLGHVASSVLLGFVGVSFGVAVTHIDVINSFRGNLAAWGLITFGLLYSVWGIRQAVKNKPHKHLHAHDEKDEHEHTHNHSDAHVHVHTKGKKNRQLTPWVLFTIFLFGPCEPLIPLLMYPAAQGSYWGIVSVIAVFGAVTIATMMSIVLMSAYGLNFVPVAKMERYTHTLAGVTILMCGLSIQFMGL
jgi:nickel/cobalt exporter